ncbi:hypothetical protein SCHPADRAFT_923845 [Schizopora paradoxa]|uniref:Uncharacterized protein n=1 Tax=Schizopora paradoxa TaxID=27342 RepID=A0A0H2SG01_9AGAM|nr:hypothetical protein SCHPADRAFT_923845 [Schizopora paradoxa]
MTGGESECTQPAGMERKGDGDGEMDHRMDRSKEQRTRLAYAMLGESERTKKERKDSGSGRTDLSSPELTQGGYDCDSDSGLSRGPCRQGKNLEPKVWRDVPGGVVAQTRVVWTSGTAQGGASIFGAGDALVRGVGSKNLLVPFAKILRSEEESEVDVEEALEREDGVPFSASRELAGAEAEKEFTWDPALRWCSLVQAVSKTLFG